MQKSERRIRSYHLGVARKSSTLSEQWTLYSLFTFLLILIFFFCLYSIQFFQHNGSSSGQRTRIDQCACVIFSFFILIIHCAEARDNFVKPHLTTCSQSFPLCCSLVFSFSFSTCCPSCCVHHHFLATLHFKLHTIKYLCFGI